MTANLLFFGTLLFTGLTLMLVVVAHTGGSDEPLSTRADQRLLEWTILATNVILFPLSCKSIRIERDVRYLAVMWRAVAIGAIGPTTFLMMVLVQRCNAASDPTAHVVQMSIDDAIFIRRSSDQYELRLSSRDDPLTFRRVAWRRYGYPVGWDKPGNCFVGQVGEGRLGLAWVKNGSIEPCSPA